MPLFIMGFLMMTGVAAVAGLRLWMETIRLREEVDQLRLRQNELIELVSTKMLEDDALSREILQLKIGQKRPSR